MEHKKYWQSLGELKQTEAYEKGLEDEFAEDLPVAEDAKLLDAKTPRRDFLKFLGFSTAAAMARDMPWRGEAVAMIVERVA